MITRGRNRRLEKGSLEGRRSIVSYPHRSENYNHQEQECRIYLCTTNDIGILRTPEYK